MKEKRVHGFKHYLMMVLVTIVNVIYHTNLSAYQCQNSSSIPSGYVACLTISSFNNSLCPGAKNLCSSYICVSSGEAMGVPSCLTGSSYMQSGVGCLNATNSLLVVAYDSCRCVPGYYPGWQSCKPCTIGYACPGVSLAASPSLWSTQCSAGTVAGGAASTCTKCSQGTYQDEPGMSSCKCCAAGTFANTTGNTSCKNANKGQYVSQTCSSSATPCQSGTYRNGYSGTSQSSCTPCPSAPSGSDATVATKTDNWDSSFGTYGGRATTDCYLVSTTFSSTDSTGTWKNKSNCPYVE